MLCENEEHKCVYCLSILSFSCSFLFGKFFKFQCEQICVSFSSCYDHLHFSSWISLAKNEIKSKTKCPFQRKTRGIWNGFKRYTISLILISMINEFICLFVCFLLFTFPYTEYCHCAELCAIQFTATKFKRHDNWQSKSAIDSISVFIVQKEKKFFFIDFLIQLSIVCECLRWQPVHMYMDWMATKQPYSWLYSIELKPLFVVLQFFFFFGWKNRLENCDNDTLTPIDSHQKRQYI